MNKESLEIHGKRIKKFYEKVTAYLEDVIDISVVKATDFTRVVILKK